MKTWKQITLTCICAVLSVAAAACARSEAKPQAQTSVEAAEAVGGSGADQSARGYASAGLDPHLKTSADAVNSEAKAVLEIYKKILLNETGFYDEDNRVGYLRDLNYKQFAILDMNLYADGIPELVLHNTADGDTLVLHYYNGAVHGKEYGYRAIRNLKIDGFFNWSNGAHNSGLGKLHITGKDQEIINMAEYGSLMKMSRCIEFKATRSV